MINTRYNTNPIINKSNSTSKHKTKHKHINKYNNSSIHKIRETKHGPTNKTKIQKQNVQNKNNEKHKTQNNDN